MSTAPPRRRDDARPTTRTTWALALGLMMSSCVVGPDYVKPEPELPDSWHQRATADLDDAESPLHSWWELLEDPLLDEFIRRAGAGNLELVQAFQRIREARALRGIAIGERYPDANGIGGAKRSRTSKGIAEPSLSPPHRTDNFYNTGLDATWELDIWGRITRSIESADASLQAQVEDYRDVLVLLYAEVAINYVEARALQTRIEYAERNAEAQRGTLQLTTDRYEAEISPELDVRQAELNVAETESAIPRLRQLLMQSIHRISVLLGEQPGALYDEFANSAPIPSAPPSIVAGVPADLLRQRPDIRSAERALAAQSARIGVATAELYPTFTLAGTFQYQTSGAAQGSMLSPRNQAWSLGPSFSWNLFDGGRVRNAIQFEEERTAELYAAYEQTILEALEDVENSMVAFLEERLRRDFLEQSVQAARRSVELVEELYRTGLTNFQNVLDMQRSLFGQEDSLAESEGLVTQNLIRSYRALGGGWVPDPEALAVELQDAEENGEPIF